MRRRAEPMAKSAKDEIGRACARKNVIGREAASASGGFNESFTSSWGRGAQEPGKELLEGGQDLGRRREPRIEHIGINDFCVEFERIEFWDDRVKKGAAMETGGGFAKRKAELPIRIARQTI